MADQTSLPSPSPSPAVSGATEAMYPATEAIRSPPGRIAAILSQRPLLRATSEYDSDEGQLLHKLSCKLAGGFAKLRLSFGSDLAAGRKVVSPVVGLFTRHFSVQYDVENNDAFVQGSVDLAGGAVRVRASRSFVEEQGEVTITAKKFRDPTYKLELSSLVPCQGLPRATLHFPAGEVSVEETIEEDRTTLSVNGSHIYHVPNGVLKTQFYNDGVKLKYRYKDSELSLIPCISLPSNALSMSFKRHFSPSDKISYQYVFDTDNWNAVYKHTVGKDIKFKAGYDSDPRLGWMSIWLGEEGGKAKSAPMKMTAQFMLQVYKDDICNPHFMFRVKKRWDF